MDTYSTEELQQILPSVLEEITEKKLQCKVSTENGNVVLLSEETYHNIVITLELLSTPGLINKVDAQLEEEIFSEASVS